MSISSQEKVEKETCRRWGGLCVLDFGAISCIFIGYRICAGSVPFRPTHNLNGKQKAMKHARIFAAALALLILAAPSYAYESSIYGSNTHVLGLNDTKGDARILCYSGLVKSLCQRVAQALSRDPAIVSAGVTKDELFSKLPFLLKVEVMGESFGVHGDDIALTMNGRADVSTVAITAAMVRMKGDVAYRAEVAAGLEKFASLERDVRSRQARLSAETAGLAVPVASPAANPAVSIAASQPSGTSPVAAVVLAAPVTASGPVLAAPVVPAAMPAPGVEIPKAPAFAVATAPPVAEAAVMDEKAVFPMSFPAAEAPEALYTLRSGMSYRDMLETAGAPAQRSECGNKVFYNYANVWVYFNDGELVGYLLMENWKGPCHPYVGFMGEILYF